MLWEPGSENDAGIRNRVREIKFNLLSLMLRGKTRLRATLWHEYYMCPIDMWHMGQWHLTFDPTSRSDRRQRRGNEEPSFLSRIEPIETVGSCKQRRNFSQNWSSHAELSLMGPQQPLSLIALYFRLLWEIRDLNEAIHASFAKWRHKKHIVHTFSSISDINIL